MMNKVELRCDIFAAAAMLSTVLLGSWLMGALMIAEREIHVAADSATRVNAVVVRHKEK